MLGLPGRVFIWTATDSDRRGEREVIQEVMATGGAMG